VLLLHDIDLLLAEVRSPAGQGRLRKMGFELGDVRPLERLRARVVSEVDRRWLSHYERAHGRYGRAVAAVRERVCQGCYITLPTSASPGMEASLTLCESCGRILYWR
jgi:predicted  nucleic acid-binding Zn-ribbon protein